MEEKKNELISQSNALTSSRYDFSPTEKNVLYHIIQKVRHDYIEGTMQRDLWDNMYVQINATDLSRIADEDHTQRARKALRDLRHKDIEIEDEEGNWLTVGFINYAKYNARTKTYEVEVSKEIMPHLVELARNFTTYSLTVAITLKSRYSQRFYEWAHQYLGRNTKTFFFDIADLRHMLKLGDGYKLKADLWMEYYDEGRGDATRFFFKIHTKEENQEQERQRVDDLLKMTRYIAIVNNRIFRKDPKFRERVEQALNFSPEKIRPVFDRLTRLEKDEKASQLPALWRYILKNDFDIK